MARAGVGQFPDATGGTTSSKTSPDQTASQLLGSTSAASVDGLTSDEVQVANSMLGTDYNTDPNSPNFGKDPYGNSILDNRALFSGATDPATGAATPTDLLNAGLQNINTLGFQYQPPGTVSTYTNAHQPAGDRMPADQVSPPQTAVLPNAQFTAAAQINPAAANYVQSVVKAAAQYGVPWQVLYAVLQHESHFNPKAVSPTGDYGIAQINLSSHPDVTRQQADDPSFAIPWAAQYIAQGYAQYHDWGLAVAFYNDPAAAKALSNPTTAHNQVAGIGAVYMSQVFGGMSAAQWSALGWDPGDNKNIGTTYQGLSGVGSGGAPGSSNLPISYRLIKPDPATLQVDARQMLGGLLYRTPSDGEVGQLVQYVQGVYDNVSAQLQQSADAGTLPLPNSDSLPVQAATAYIGTAYKWGGNSAPGGPGVDCSGLVQNVFKSLGVDLPRTTFEQVKTGTAVGDISQAQPGDLVFMDAGDGSNSHVGIYIGNGQVLDALNSHTPVTIHQISDIGKVTAIRRENLPANAAATYSASGGSQVNPTDNSGAANGATGGAPGTSPATGQVQGIDPETGYPTGPLRQKIDPQAELLTAIRALPEYQALYGQKPGNLTEDAYSQHFADMAQSLVGPAYANTQGVGQAVRSGMETNNPTTTAESIAVSSDAQQSPTYRGLMYQRALDFAKLAYGAPASPGATV